MKGKQNEKDFSDFIKPGFGDLHDSCDGVRDRDRAGG